MIAREVRLFFIALQFLTRLPVPSLPDVPPDWLARSAKYMPLAGALIGATAGAAGIAVATIFPIPLPMVIALAVAVAITGALHEDGLADVADAFGVARSRERTLEILKDSRIGTFGALALVICLALKAAALTPMDVLSMARVLIAGHAAARLAAVLTIVALPHAGTDTKVSAPAGTMTAPEIATAIVFGLLPGLVLLQTATFTVSILFASAGAAVLAFLARRRIGGYTGDVLGAVEQVFETLFFMFAASVISGPG